MPTTLLNLREQIRLDYKLEGDPNFPITRLTLMINQAQRYVQIQLNGLGFKKWEKIATLTLGPNVFVNKSLMNAALSLTPDMIESPKSIRFVEVGDGTTYGLAYEVSEAFAYEHLNNSLLAPTIKDPFFFRMDNFIWLAPSTILTGTLHYYAVITDLAADTDATQIPTEFVQYITKRVGIEIDAIRGLIVNKDNAIAGLSDQITGAWQKFMNTQQQKDVDKKANLQ